MASRVQAEDFDPQAEIDTMCGGRTDIGAVVSFVGLVRGEAGGLETLELEHYPGMTEAALADIEARAADRWPLAATRIVHRVGPMRPGERIVLAAAASAHRHAAFEAAAFLMDFLKTDAPFWKRAVAADGSATWVDARESDAAAKARW